MSRTPQNINQLLQKALKEQPEFNIYIYVYIYVIYMAHTPTFDAEKTTSSKRQKTIHTLQDAVEEKSGGWSPEQKAQVEEKLAFLRLQQNSGW